MKHRTASVIILSGVSMLGCLMWWGRLSLTSSAATILEFHNTDNTTTSTPPPFLFQSTWVADDDESEFTGDDDGFKQGERIRGKVATDKKTTTNKKPKRSTNSSKVNDKLSASNSTTNNFGWENYESRPKIVWLMSYPNSGTSYTMTMVGRATNRATGSNYGREVTENGVPNAPLYPGQLNGPYYRPDPRKPLPKDYILVKTHCGG